MRFLILKKKFIELETEKTKLKDRITEFLRQIIEESKRRDVKNAKFKARIKKLKKNKTDFLAKNIRRDNEIAELKAEQVKLRNSNKENKQSTKDIFEVAINISYSIINQYNKEFQRNQIIFLPFCLRDQKSSEDRKITLS